MHAEAQAAASSFDWALLSDVGTERSHNEDSGGSFVESGRSVLIVVADGVGGYEGGELASRMAVDVTIASYKQSPASWGTAKRLYRAVQQANIEIHDRALVVPELRKMATTVTAVVICDGALFAVHVGDTRLYLIRGDRISQLTKDHTVAGARQRLGILSRDRAREHPERSTLTRSLGPDLIVAADKLSILLERDDVVLICTDGLYNVLGDNELSELARTDEAETAVKRLVTRANEKGTFDNVTAAVFRLAYDPPSRQGSGLKDRVRKLLGRP